MIVTDLIRELEKARDAGYALNEVQIVHASGDNPEQVSSGAFPLLSVDLADGVNLVQSNYISHYVPKVFERDRA